MMTTNRPNILYLHSHDTGRYIQPYGYAVPTPHLQRLAKQGVLFRQMFCAAPTCSPSRAALLTGQWAHSAGILGLVNRGFEIADPKQTFVHALREAGYATALSGVTHIAKNKEEIGYDEILAAKGSGSASAAVSYIERQCNSDGPFFLDVGFSDTHRDFGEAEEDPRYCMPPAPLPDTPETRADMAAYKTSVRRLDNGIGQILEALDRTGLGVNTLVICTTDHGLAFPAMKCNLTDHGMGVLFLLRGPQSLANGVFSGGRVCDAMLSQIDVFPTLCELLQIAPPAWLQGRSMMPLLRGEAEEINETVFAEVNFHSSFEPMRAVRTKRWKYIRRYDGRSTPVLVHCDDSPSKTLWHESGWREQFVEEAELYDLMFDPAERRNLAGDPAHESVLREMRERLEQWMQATDDPLLREVFPVPDGVRVNHPDSLGISEPLVNDPAAFANDVLRQARQR